MVVKEKTNLDIWAHSIDGKILCCSQIHTELMILPFQNDDSNSKLANLKRRLTMLSSRMASTDGSSSNTGNVDSTEDQNRGGAACEG